MTALDEQYENFTEQLAPIKSWLDKTAVILQESDKLSAEEMISESEISKYKVSKMCSFLFIFTLSFSAVEEALVIVIFELRASKT